MTSPDAPTQAFRTATRPLDAVPATDAPPWACGRCKGPVAEFGQGHYVSTCLATLEPSGFHFCCPLPAGCELQAA